MGDLSPQERGEVRTGCNFVRSAIWTGFHLSPSPRSCGERSPYQPDFVGLIRRVRGLFPHFYTDKNTYTPMPIDATPTRLAKNHNRLRVLRASDSAEMVAPTWATNIA